LPSANRAIHSAIADRRIDHSDWVIGPSWHWRNPPIAQSQNLNAHCRHPRSLNELPDVAIQQSAMDADT
jgi:hypothetical protein